MELSITRSDYDTLYTCTEMSHRIPEGCTITVCCGIVFKLPRTRFGIFFPMSLAMGQTSWELVTLYYRTETKTVTGMATFLN